MAVDVWMRKICEAEKTCIIDDGKRKVHYNFDGGNEMAEEYDLVTSSLIVRKWRQKSTFGGLGEWQFEIGEQPYNQKQLEVEGIKESQQNPVFYRLDEGNAFQWKVRNIPHKLENYEVAVDSVARHIYIKTLNKTYYKKFSIPDMDRCCLPYEKDKLSVNLHHKTLIIKYEKPREILQMEVLMQAEVQKLKPLDRPEPSDCNPS